MISGIGGRDKPYSAARSTGAGNVGAVELLAAAGSRGAVVCAAAMRASVLTPVVRCGEGGKVPRGCGCCCGCCCARVDGGLSAANSAPARLRSGERLRSGVPDDVDPDWLCSAASAAACVSGADGLSTRFMAVLRSVWRAGQRCNRVTNAARHKGTTRVHAAHGLDSQADHLGDSPLNTRQVSRCLHDT